MAVCVRCLLLLYFPQRLAYQKPWFLIDKSPDFRECAWRMGTLQPSRESCWCQVCWLQSSNHLAPDDQKPKFLATMVIIIPCVAHDPDHDEAGVEHGLWRTPPGPQRGQGGTRDSLPSECYPAKWCQYWCRHWCEHGCRQRCWHRVGAGAVTGAGGGISSGVGTGANTRVWNGTEVRAAGRSGVSA